MLPEKGGCLCLYSFFFKVKRFGQAGFFDTKVCSDGDSLIWQEYVKYLCFSAHSLALTFVNVLLLKVLSYGPTGFSILTGRLSSFP